MEYLNSYMIFAEKCIIQGWKMCTQFVYPADKNACILSSEFTGSQGCLIGLGILTMERLSQLIIVSHISISVLHSCVDKDGILVITIKCYSTNIACNSYHSFTISVQTFCNDDESGPWCTRLHVFTPRREDVFCLFSSRIMSIMSFIYSYHVLLFSSFIFWKKA